MPNSEQNYLPADHPEVAYGKIGVLLVNLGTPDECTPQSVRTYLGEFLADQRVIESPAWLWKPVLHGIILRTRPGKVAAAYKKIWRSGTNESPLRYYTRRQAELLSGSFDDRNHRPVINWAMRYGRPSIREGLDGLLKKGCERILIAPLYPQYSATTTATVNDCVFDVLKTLRWQPAVRTLPPYFDHPAYIEAIAESINDYLSTCERKPETIIVSYHGLPQSYLESGDPYYCHCSKTTRLLRERLDMDKDSLVMSFQSRFGPKQWLQPYADKLIESLAKEGNKAVAAIMPGFSSDCLETLEEMGMQNRDLFLENGGESFEIIPCLNDSATGMRMLEILVRQELSGWI